MIKILESYKVPDEIKESGEEWRPIEGQHGYFISNQGRVWSGIRGKGKLLKLRVLPIGYVPIMTRRPEELKPKLYYVHRLVAQAFLGHPPQGAFVNHKNSVRTDNRVENLEWCTHQENIEHGVLAGNMAKKLTAKDVYEIWKLLNQGLNCAQVARIYNLHKSSIARIKSGKTWDHLLEGLSS